jgi:hypothetical protein
MTTADKAHIKELGNAMFCNALPTNPTPFLNALIVGVKEEGTNWLRSDEARRLIWLINTMSFSDMATINQTEEFNRLYTEKFNELAKP